MKRRMLVICLALALAVLGTVGVLFYVRQADDRAIAGQQAVTVLVADKRVPAGTTAEDALAQKLLRSERMPSSSVPSDAVHEVGSDLDKLVTSSELAPGQLLVRSMLVSAEQITDGIAIPDGKIAVTVPVEAWQRAGGLAKKGTKVAVFNTFNVLENKAGLTPAGDKLSEQHDYNKATRLLLSGIEVLAVLDDVTVSQEDREKGVVGKAIVTVAVTQSEAERLVLAQQTGSIYLALQSSAPDLKAGNGVDNRTMFENANGS